jgi:NADH-quinone oxidoreductase subunit G
LTDLAAGKGSFGEILAQAKNPLIIVGEGAVSHAAAQVQADLAATYLRWRHASLL